jgi:tRNA U34 5-carboxymethylaminomethyl modifying GTPase MnmE/TrmE
MTLPLIRIAVVGHTNTGKTSLLRTMTRDVGFGEVSNRAATTRRVEATTLLIDGAPAITLFDTPGLEDSSGLLEHLDRRRQEMNSDWTDAIASFLEDDRPPKAFRQEAKALRQLLDCDISLYVIDARDTVHGKHKDELEILGRSGRPILPVLNFVADPEAKPDLWRAQLARVNMHAVAAYDTVVLDELNELQLYEKIKSLIDPFKETLEAVIADVTERRRALRRASATLISNLLIDAAAYVLTVSSESEDDQREGLENLKQRLRDGEQHCVEALMELHRFKPGDFLSETLPIEEGAWGLDLFSPESLTEFGLATGTAAATGALAGLAVDAMVGGMTLGAAALTGAAVGGLAGAVSSRGREILDGLRGYRELRAERGTLALLAHRQIALVRALLRRGHASQERLRLREADVEEKKEALTDDVLRILKDARHHPEWSRFISAASIKPIGGRPQVEERLTAVLSEALSK